MVVDQEEAQKKTYRQIMLVYRRESCERDGLNCCTRVANLEQVGRSRIHDGSGEWLPYVIPGKWQWRSNMESHVHHDD